MTPGSEALQVLAGPGMALAAARASVPARPGLYAVHGGPSTWQELGLGAPPDARPLYVGKAERSLAGRDLRQHFGVGSTGSSTLRRSLAALLRARLELRAIPRRPDRPVRPALYALSEADDLRLSTWMQAHLRLAVWVPVSPVRLGMVEAQVLKVWQPPLNLTGVRTAWTPRLRAARKAMAGQATATGTSR